MTLSPGTPNRRFRVMIEAMQVPKDAAVVDEDGNGRDFMAWGALSVWLGPGDWRITGDLGIDIPTLEGTMHANPGDWIIRGVKGELYPCKPDIFEATYEPF